MFTHEYTMELIGKAQLGDESAKSLLVSENIPLVKSLIKRYIGKHAEYEDLVQIASIGLLKAIDNFSTSYNVRFSTYAVPLILGEVKRFMRDDSYIKVSRSTKMLARNINRYIEQYRNDNNDDPSLEQIASQFEITTADTVFAMDSVRMPISLFDKNDSDDSKSISLADRLASNSHIELDNSIVVGDMLTKLTDREKQLIQCRYFMDMTQSEIAKLMDISQVQVSRLEYKIIEKLRTQYTQE